MCNKSTTTNGPQVINDEVMMTCEQHKIIREKFGDVRVKHDYDGFYVRSLSRYIHFDAKMEKKKLGVIVMIRKDSITHTKFNAGISLCRSMNSFTTIAKYSSPTFKALLEAKEDFNIEEVNGDTRIYYIPHVYMKCIVYIKIFKNYNLFYEKTHEFEDEKKIHIPLTFAETGDHKFDVEMSDYNNTYQDKNCIDGNIYCIFAFRVC